MNPDMDWLAHASLSTLIGVTLIGLVCLYLYHQERRRHLLIWSGAWGAYALRLAVLLVILHSGPRPLLVFLNQAFALIHGLMLFWGVLVFVERRFHPAWFLAGAAGCAWAGVAVAADWPFLWLTLPIFLLQAVVYLSIGAIFLSRPEVQGLGGRIAGWAFVLWGLHKLDYPFLRPILWLAPWGYLLSAVLAMICGLSIILIFFEREKRNTAESENRYRRFVELANEGVWALDADYRIAFSNRKQAEMLGVDLEDMLGRPVEDYIHPDDLPAHYRQVEDRKRGLPARYERRFLRTDGRLVWAIVSATPQFDDQSRFAGSFAMITDITERKEMELALAESRRRLMEAQRIARMADWEYDLSSRELAWSPVVYDMMGVNSGGELSLSDLPSFVHPEDLGRVKSILQLVVNTGGENETEFRALHPNGAVIHLNSRVAAQTDDQGRVVKLLGTVQDVTERRRAEAEQKRLQEKLQQAQKMEALGTLAAGVAHDFNNILGAIFGSVELARLNLHDAQAVDQNLERSLKAAARARDLVTQILTFSRKTRKELAPIHIQPILKEAVKFLRSSLPSTIEIRLDIAPTPARIMGDPTQVHQIIMNICTNAAQAMSETGGLLMINLSVTDPNHRPPPGLSLPEGEYALLTISDTGPGMPPSVAQRVFEPYFTTKAAGEGTGLGLSVVHGIVQSYGGGVFVDSRPGRGTDIHVYLPHLDEDAAAARPPVASTLAQGWERLMVVDDELDLVRINEEMLARLGYRVQGFSVSHDAWAAFQAHPDQWDLLVTDQTMPGLTGLELVEKARAVKPDLPVVLCTGHNNAEVMRSAEDMGVNRVMVKPVTAASLSAAIRESLDGDGP